MEKFLLLSVVVVLVAAAAQAGSNDERAVRTLVDRFIQAGNSVDPAVVRSALAEYSVTAGPLYLPFGEAPASVADFTAQIEQALPLLAARTFTPTSPLAVHTDKNSAWCAFSWHAEYTFKDGTGNAFDGRLTLVFAKERKRWKLKHWHGSLPGSPPATAASLDAAAEDILQRERAAWEALKNRQAPALGAYFADNVSYLDESQAYRVRGKQDLLRGLTAQFAQKRIRAWQMLDPQVEVMGDTAVLTYYFTEAGTNAGKEYSTAGKISVVFARGDDGWHALHYHRSVNPQHPQTRFSRLD